MTSPAPAAGAAAWEWDDRLWERIWERVLDPVERHAIAVAVWRRRLPDELFEARVAVELARRWRRRAVVLAVVYALWTLFWGALARRDWAADGAFESLLCPVNALVGVAAVLACAVFSLRLRAFARQSP